MAFDEQQARGEMSTGCYVECIVRTETIIERATAYARERNNKC